MTEGVWHRLPDSDKLHFEKGPAVMYAGRKEYWLNNKRDNPNGPAIIYPDGSLAYYANDEPHREDGPAWIGRDGYKIWYARGVPHRDPKEGAAVEHRSGYKVFYVRGLKHNPFGAAVVHAPPDTGLKEWWLGGKQLQNAAEHARALRPLKAQSA